MSPDLARSSCVNWIRFDLSTNANMSDLVKHCLHNCSNASQSREFIRMGFLEAQTTPLHISDDLCFGSTQWYDGEYQQSRRSVLASRSHIAAANRNVFHTTAGDVFAAEEHFVATCDQNDLVLSAASPRTSMGQRQQSRHRSRILWTICAISSSIVSYRSYPSTAPNARSLVPMKNASAFDYSPRSPHIRLAQAGASVKSLTNTAAWTSQDPSLSQMP